MMSRLGPSICLSLKSAISSRLRCRESRTQWVRVFASISLSTVSRGQDFPRHFTEADAIAGALAPAGHRHTVAIQEKRPPLAVGEVDRLGPLPGEFQQAAERVG